MSRRVLVTGASSGIGAELARQLIRRGDEVWLAARNEERLDLLVSELGERARKVVLDVTDLDVCAETVTAIDAECGGLDLVVANAGIGEGRPSTETGWPWTRDVLMTNLMGAAATIAPLIPRMAERGRGHVAGISSLSIHVEAVRGACYAGAKAGLSHYLHSLRPELGAAGIAVTVIEPGFIRTPMTEGNRSGMPFLMDVEPAVRRIVGALDRRVALYRFPRRTSWLLGATRLVPRRLRDRLAVRMIASA